MKLTQKNLCYFFVKNKKKMKCFKKIIYYVKDFGRAEYENLKDVFTGACGAPQATNWRKWGRNTKDVNIFNFLNSI